MKYALYSGRGDGLMTDDSFEANISLIDLAKINRVLSIEEITIVEESNWKEYDDTIEE